jgi:hypothetical protein
MKATDEAGEKKKKIAEEVSAAAVGLNSEELRDVFDSLHRLREILFRSKLDDVTAHGVIVEAGLVPKILPLLEYPEYVHFLLLMS